MSEHVRTDEDPTSETQEVPTEVLSSFRTLYPGATHIVWEKSGDYYVSYFETGNNEGIAWFDNEGVWYQYKGSISSRDMNQTILAGLYETGYATWNIGETGILQRKEMGTTYMIEVKQGNEDYNLYFTENGIFVKIIDHNYDNPVPVIIPDEISNFVQSNYSEPVIYEFVSDNLGIEVGIVEEELFKTIVMDGYFDWLCTLWDVKEEEIPSAVKSGFNRSKYAAYDLFNIKLMMKVRNEITQPFYTYYLKNDGKTYLVTFTQTGNLDIAISV